MSSDPKTLESSPSFDEDFMQLAFKEAETALKEGEVPVK
jgi:hypothetical protein